MLQHIASTINDSKEIENFYDKVLFVNMNHKFSMNSKVSQKIFNIKGETDVCVGESYNTCFVWD
jgi:hypothetical protein